MFSSFTSFLPTSLRDTQRVTPPVQQEEEQPRLGVVKPLPEPTEEAEPQPSQKPKRERERRHANEVFVIVRPPPAKSNHPLNLQVQLVPPHSKAVLPRSSTEFDPSQSTPLYRTSTNHSQESSTTYASTTSFSSGASTATSSTSSTRRAIVPLYNLQAHNVLPNVIVDAGTDAKVAKFQKRGMELVNLVLLEPVEVWPDPNAAVMSAAVTGTTLSVPIVGPEASTSTLGRLSVDEMGFAQIHTRAGTATGRSVAAFLAAPVRSSSSRPTTPEVPAVITAASSSSSLPSASHRVDQTKYPEISAKQESHYPPPASDVLSPNSGKRTIFGRIFKKNGKEVSLVGSPPPTPLPSVLGNANKRQPLSAHSQSPPVRRETRDSPDGPNSQNHTPTQLQHMVTPTPHQHPYLGSKAAPASAGNKRASGIRGPWLLGSPSSIKSPSQPQSPLAAAFSSLGMKRRSVLHPGQEGEGSPSINLNEAQDEVAGSSQPTSALALTGVPQSNQAQPQPPQSVLGVQPTRCVVPSTVVTASRSYRRYQSRSPDDGSVEGADANDSVNGGKPLKDKDDKRDKVLSRVYMYVWLARKWMKRRPSPPQQINHKQENTRFGLGLPIGGSGKGLGLDTTWVHSFKGHEFGVEETVEVRLEWKRGSIGTNLKKKQNDVSNDGAAAGAEEDAECRKRRNEERRSHSRQREEPKAATRVETIDVGSVERNRKRSSSSISSARAAVKRWSLLSHQSRSTASEDGDGDEDLGDESDPEDSETPWVCTLKVRRTNIAAAKEVGRGRSKGKAAGGGSEDTVNNWENKQVLKIKVGTLSPTPHHPKVVAMLKVPFPLPDVQVERLEAVKRGGLGEFLISPVYTVINENYLRLCLVFDRLCTSIVLFRSIPTVRGGS
ncbi:hypothetical protein JOM56_011105 [Amanita muscaria]